MFSVFFREAAVNGYDDARDQDTDAFRRFFHAMLQQGVYLAPSAYEAGFVSSAHDEAVIEATLAAAREAFADVMR